MEDTSLDDDFAKGGSLSSLKNSEVSGFKELESIPESSKLLGPKRVPGRTVSLSSRLAESALSDSAILVSFKRSTVGVLDCKSFANVILIRNRVTGRLVVTFETV
jgi:hypothetical protein